MTEKVIITIVGAIAGLLPLFMSSYLSRREKRTRVSRQDRALDLANRRIEFLETWVKVQQTLSSPDRYEEIKREAAAELDELKLSLSEHWGVDKMKEGPEEPEQEKSFGQRLFLAYRPNNMAGWILHTLFYMLLGMILFLSLGIGYDIEADEFSMALFWADFPLLIIFLGIPLLIIRWFAVRTDRKAREKMVKTHAGEAK